MGNVRYRHGSVRLAAAGLMAIVFIAGTLAGCTCSSCTPASEPEPAAQSESKPAERPRSIQDEWDVMPWAVDGGSLDSNPKLVRYVPPSYPADDRQAGTEAEVLVRVQIGIDGKVKEAAIVGGDGTPGMERSALAAARKYLFKPGMRDGKPVECAVTGPVRFKLYAD